MRPEAGQLYKHFKGNVYQIVTIAKHSETGEELVIYRPLYGTDQTPYARPLEMFVSPVDKQKYPDVTQKYRFEPFTFESVSFAKEQEKCENKPGGVQPETAPEESVILEDKKEVAEEENDFAEELDPKVLAFLDARTFEEKLDILHSVRDRITNEMINTMAVSVDLEIDDGAVEERYDELKNCLLTFHKYETTRLR